MVVAVIVVLHDDHDPGHAISSQPDFALRLLPPAVGASSGSRIFSVRCLYPTLRRISGAQDKMAMLPG